MDTNYIVRSTDGSVNIDGTVAAFTKSLRDWVSANEISVDRLDTAIDGVFDENKGQERLPKQGIVTLAVTRLNLNANQLGTVSERLNKYIMNNPRFHTFKGKGGGVMRLARAGEPIPAIEVKSKDKKTA